MQSKMKWLLLPPAIALVLFIGPLQSQSTSTTERAPAESARTTRTALPEMPSAWQLASTLLGVLLLGGVGITVLRRTQRGRPIGDGEYVVLRQSVRLSQKHAIHAVEFNNAVLLVGECDGNLSVLQGGAPVVDAATDEAEILARPGIDEGDPDGGAVPRDMVIPRPAAPARAQPSRPTNPQVAAKIANFKNLLTRVGAGAGQ